MSAKSDYLIQRIKDLQTFQTAMTNKSPITVSISGVDMTVDSTTAADEYARGAEVLQGIVTRSITVYSLKLAEEIVSISAPPSA